MFQDDVVRLAINVSAARAGNERIMNVVKLKQLEMHPDKTGVIIFGDKKSVAREIEQEPIRFNDFVTKPKVMDKWLGEMFHMDGLGSSVNATVEDRVGKVKAAAREIVSVIEDFRMQSIGGAMGALDLWEAAVLPALLYNSETWVEIPSKTIETLEEIQNYFVRFLLQVPVSTPKPSLLSETGLMSIKFRIWARKLTFTNYLKNMPDESLAGQIFHEQVKRGWPGLAQEARDICSELGLPNIVKENIGKSKWESMVKKAVREVHERELKESVESKTKLEEIKNQGVKVKEYFSGRNIVDTRMMFRIRTRMIELKANFKNNQKFKKEGWKCEGCGKEVETNGHVMNCIAYEHVRDGKDLTSDEDLVQFFKEVMKMRMQRKNN